MAGRPGRPRQAPRPPLHRDRAPQPRRRWKRVADDLGVAIVWTGDAAGAYSAHWQVPRKAKPGTYRVVVTANYYRLRSAGFRVDPAAPATNTDPTHPAAIFAPVTRK